MKQTNRSGCLVLCGGRSSRMKQDKAKLIYNDKTFLQILCAGIRSMGMPGYISLSDNDEEIPADFTALKDEVYDDSGRSVGPLGGIYTGLKQCERDRLDGIYTVPVDLPLFDTELFVLVTQAMRSDPQADMYILVSSDGRIHPTAGYYRTSVISAAAERIRAGDYRLMSLLRHPDLRMVRVLTENTEQDRMLFNVNTPADYASLTAETYRPDHIVLQGEKGSGKSTLIQRLVTEMKYTVGGYLTRAVMNPEQGYREIYMYPASFLTDPDTAAKTDGKLCGIAMHRIIEACPDVFDTYGTDLIHAASKKQLIVMDEIGLMEDKAERFQKAVLSAFDGNIPVIAAVKAKEKTSLFLEMIRTHKNVQLIEVNETNREEVYEQLRQFLRRKGDPQ